MNLDDARSLFAAPPTEARPTPFWFWNDRLDPERLKWQLDRLLAAGAGGAVLHARHGLDVDEYLDERWFKAVGAVVEHARQRGAYTWLYDELGWPSGTAGGRIPREHPEFRMLHLRMYDMTLGAPSDVETLPGDHVAAFHVTHSDLGNGRQRRHDGSVTLLPDRIEYAPIDGPFRPDEWVGRRVLVFRKVPLDGAVNYLDRRATEAFLESTHAEYFRRFGGHFGETIRHIFMDEAGMNPQASWLPWDSKFAEQFHARCGYALTPKLPALFFDVPGCETVRYHYWGLVADLFRENFAIPMHEWCSKHGVAYTGHYVFEATLKEATRQLGSVMPLYEYQGLIGIDILGNDFYSHRFEREAYGYYVVTIKQAASVSRQLRDGAVMSESYGVGGHSMGPQEMQTATNFQMALGVTHIAQHAAFYSLRGDRKLDCPPVIGWQEPYWPFVRKHMDTTSRSGWLLSQGRSACDVLLLHPATSMQATYRHYRVKEEYKAENYLLDADLPFEMLDKHFTLLSVALLDAQIDHDYGDEIILERHAAVEGASLRVGAQVYAVVVLPPLVNIRSTTLTLLREFAAKQGILITVGSAPRLVDGRPCEDAAVFLNAHAKRIVDGVDFFDYQPVVCALTECGVRTLTAKSPDGTDIPALKAQRRTWGDREVFFVANVSRESVTARVAFNPGVTGNLEEWDAASGKTRTLAPCSADRPVSLDLEWAARQARIFVVVPGEALESVLDARSDIRRIRPTWRTTRNGPNILVLDRCRFVGRKESRELLSVSQVQAELRMRLEEAAEPVTLTTQFVFFAGDKAARSTGYELAIELGDDPEVLYHRQPLPLHETEWLLDPAIRRIPLPGLSHGNNVIEVRGTYRDATDFQSPWLLGDFRPHSDDDATFAVEAEKTALGIGAWPAQGLPFFAGTVTYAASFDLDRLAHGERVVLDMPGLSGSAEVRVNGRVVDHVLWPPYACDLTEAVKPGPNTVEVEVAGTLRNLLGPHFDPDEEIHTGYGGAHYVGALGQPKRFRDYGMLAAPEIIISE
ncbi:MAG: hypothetical protein HZB26_07115 [Candidatus Hydrogenedentes bacterium]|nr:hypothetical protein [Candidatus Hydrogenedentota bacterium]